MALVFPQEHLRSLLLEYLSTSPRGNYYTAVKGVIELAKSKNLYDGSQQRVQMSGGPSYDLNLNDHHIVPEKIRQLFWDFLIQGLLVFGMDDLNSNWPDYTVTDYGQEILSQQSSKPYDPDSFIAEFCIKNPTIDNVILEYLTEAVLSFNRGCFKASAVMIGCASEQAILILHETGVIHDYR